MYGVDIRARQIGKRSFDSVNPLRLAAEGTPDALGNLASIGLVVAVSPVADGSDGLLRSHGLTTPSIPKHAFAAEGLLDRAVRVSRASRALPRHRLTRSLKRLVTRRTWPARPTHSQSASLISHFESNLRNRTRMPGPSSGVPMNSMPAASNATFISIRVCVRLGGTPSTASNLLMVRRPRPDFSASSSIVHLRAARADRICIPEIIDKSLNGP